MTSKKLLTFYLKHKTLVLHILSWIVYIIYESVLVFLMNGPFRLLSILVGFALNIAVFYITAELILPREGKRVRYHLILYELLLLLITYLFAHYAVSRFIIPLIEHTPPVEPGSRIFTKLYIAQHTYRGIYFMGLSFGYWFSKRLISSERRLRIAEREQYLQELSQKELKREIAVSKLAFLQTQINPHFLFNVLNFFYSNIYPFSKKLAEAVVLLSDIMRYITKQSSEEGLVPLTDEIEHIEKYIKLNQLRFDNRLQIVFEVTGILEHKKIATFIMMSLIENAFKYGDLLDKNNPLIIKFSVLATRIEFYIENKIKLSGNIPGTGIGLQNLRKRLDLMYADDYDLIITKEGNKFKCQLKINSLL